MAERRDRRLRKIWSMANAEHVEILRQGSEVWNQWRKDNPEMRPALVGAKLGGATLIGVDLSDAYLGQADLRRARLNRANLEGANLRQADLSHTRLRGTNFQKADLNRTYFRLADAQAANFKGASLRGTDFNRASLVDSNLEQAELLGTNLRDANLSGARLADARLYEVVFGNTDLSEAHGLDECNHRGPSILDIRTISLSQPPLPPKFLKGCGFSDILIDFLPSLLKEEPVAFYSCFISHSSEDADFAKQLHANLQDKGVRCWLAEKDLKIGERFRTRIDEIIRIYDKLLVVLSENSIASDWVEREVEAAFEKERELKTTVLFPIRLDDAVMDSKDSKLGWAADIKRSRHIGDFTGWKDAKAYQKAFERLLRDLKASDSDHAR